MNKNDPADLRKSHVEVQKMKKPYNSKMQPETKLIKSLKQENTGNPAVQIDSDLNSLSNDIQNTLFLSDQMRQADETSPVSITSENPIDNIQIDSSALIGKTKTPAEVETNICSVQSTTLLGQIDRNSNAKLKEKVEAESKVSTKEKEVQNLSVSVGKAKEKANRFQFKEYLEAYENAFQIPQQKVTKEQTDSLLTDFEGALEPPLFDSKQTILNRDSEDEDGRTELCSDHMSGQSTDIKLNPQLHIRPSTAGARKPRVPASGSIGNKKCNSAVTRVTQNGIVPAAYYSSPRPNLMLKTSQMNPVPISSAGQHNLKSSKGQTIPYPESVSKATQSGAKNKVNVLPAEKHVQHGTSKGYKAITESSNDEVIKKWKLMNKSKLNKNEEKIMKEGNNSRGTEQRSDDKTAESAVLRRNGSPRVTPAVLDRVKQLQEQFGDMQLHKKESGINGQKAVINEQYLNAKSVKDKNRVVENRQSIKGHDYIVVPYGAFQASVNATKPKQKDEGCNYPNRDEQTSKSPSFGSSTSCTPDIYDGYARKTKHKSNKAEPSQGKKGNPNNINDKDKKPLDIKVGQKRGAENSYVKYVHSNSGDELHKPNLPFNSCDKLFKDLIALCEKNYSKYESKTSEPEHTSSCSHCALCQAEAIYSPGDQILNQLAYHMLERMKSLKINCVAENAENSLRALDKPVMSVALMSRSGSRISEKAVAHDEDNSTIPRKISLLDKVSSFAEKSFDEEEGHLKETSQRETEDNQSQIEETLAETGLNKANQNQLEAPSEFQLKVKDFFVPIEQPIYYRVADKGPFIPVKESFHIPDNAELYYRGTMQKTPDPCTDQSDTQLEVKNSSDVSLSTDPDALEGSEIVKSYQDNPRLYGQSTKLSKQEKRKQDLADRVCSPTNINLKLNLKEKTNFGLANSTVYLRNVVETNMGIPSEKAKQCMDCQLSASKSALKNIGIKPVVDESVIARNKANNETVTVKSDVNLELYDDKLSGCTNISLKPRPKSSARCGKRFKTNPRAKDYELHTHDTNSGLSDIFKITAAETHMHISSDLKKEEKQSQESNKEEKQSQEPISLRQRSSKSAKTAEKRTDSQAQERGRRFAERQKRQGSSGVLAAVSSIARNTFESVPQEGTSSIKFQNRQNKLRKHIQTKMKNKNKAIRNRKIKSAPQRKYGPDISRVSSEDTSTDLNQVTMNTQPTPTDCEQSENTKIAKFERPKKHVRSAKLKASRCKRKSKASPTVKDDTVITSCGVNCNCDDELRLRKGPALDQSLDAMDMILAGYEERRNKEAEAISDDIEESNSINANLNNNVYDTGTLNMAGKELNRNTVSKDTEYMKVVRSKLPKQKKRKCEKTTNDMPDAEGENAEIEIDVDEVFDWEQQYDNSISSIDEITFTITHVDGTQLIVSNKHPDFENIIKFIEEQKRNCGDESITVEAELNHCPKESVEENIHGTSTFTIKPEADVQQTLNEDENYVEMTNLENKGKCSLDEIDICPFMPLQNTDDISGKENETYSICNTLRDIIPQELIIQCFMNEEGDMKETSSLNGKDYKHHDNIFEALAPGIWSSVESPNLLGRKEKDVGDSFRNKYEKGVSSYSAINANETISELPSCKKKSLMETENQIDSYKNPVSIITNKDSDKILAEKEEQYGLSSSKLDKDLKVQYEMQDHQITSKTSNGSTGSIETLAVNQESSLINELPVVQLVMSRNEAKPHTKEEDNEQIHTTSADELNKLPDTSTLLGDLHNIYPEVRCSELFCNLDNKSEIDVRSENGAITTLQVATSQEQQWSLSNEMPSFNDSAKLILERGSYLNSADDSSNSGTGMDQNISLNEHVESSADLDNINCDQYQLSGRDDIQPDQEKLTAIKIDQQLQNQKRRKHNKPTGGSLNVMLKDIMKNDTDREEKQYSTLGTGSAKKKASVSSSNEIGGYLRDKKKSVNSEHEEEDEEEEEKRREKEEQIAAEGFIKTQQKYMEIILNNSVEIQKEEGRTMDCKSVTPRYTVEVAFVQTKLLLRFFEFIRFYFHPF